MSEKLKRLVMICMALTLATQGLTLRVASAESNSFGDVVINEIAWAGSDDSSGDEWIELYNNSNETIELAGWEILDDGSSSYLIVEGEIKPKGYFLIEDKETTVSTLQSNQVIGLSLANSGDSLMLKNVDGIPIDIVNTDGLDWYAGNANLKATMEKIDPSNLIDDSANWASATFSNGSKSSAGSEILGTPGSVNSVYDGSGPKIKITSAQQYLVTGEEFEVSVIVEDAVDMYAYGFEVKYKEDELSFIEASEGDFLKDGGSSVFNSALKNSQAGNLLVAGSKLGELSSGAKGDGEILRIKFRVLAEGNGEVAVNFGGDSFVSDLDGDVPTSFKSNAFIVSDGVVNSVKELEIREGEERYSLEISWDIPNGGADTYLINRKNPQGSYVTIAEISDAFYIDDFEIIPNVNLEYIIVPVKVGVQGEGVEITGKDQRGLTGDNNRDDIVDGRDLERLARKFASEYGDTDYAQILDTNFDGVIDGSDLIDLGINFGDVYS